jgi:hypothetical protein
MEPISNILGIHIIDIIHWISSLVYNRSSIRWNNSNKSLYCDSSCNLYNHDIIMISIKSIRCLTDSLYKVDRKRGILDSGVRNSVFLIISASFNI